MKDAVVNWVRRVSPRRVTRLIEEIYRLTRSVLARMVHGNPTKGLRIIGITGTNGKTTTAFYVNEILKEANFKTAMFTTAVIEVAGEAKLNDLNATVASTVSMQKFFKQAKQAGVDYVVLEVTSHSLDQHKLRGVEFEVVIMTNLTQDHLDYHHTMEEYAFAKSKMFRKSPRYIVLNRDDEWFEYFDKYEAGEQKMTYGLSEQADAKIISSKLYKLGSEAEVVLDERTHLDLATHLPGEFNIHNMVAATTAAYLLGVKLEDIQEGVANVEEIPGRFERVENKNGADIVVDYAHTPDALEKLLKATRDITKGRVILVFGACGDRDRSKRPIMGELAGELADKIFLTDEESYNEDPEAIRQMIREGIEKTRKAHKMIEEPDRRKAIELALEFSRAGDTVLVTGMGHEQYRIVKGERLPWNDASVIREIIAPK